MADFSINSGIGRITSTPSTSGILRANAASTSVPSSATTGDVFVPSTNLFAGSSHNVDFNAISNMSLDQALAALPGSGPGLQFLATV